MDDLISRQAAIDILRGYLVGKRCPDDGTLTFRLIENEVINKLPPIQPEPDQNGDLWITVPDIDKVTRIYVQESKSKFCRIFYEEQEQSEPYKGVTE